MSYYNKCKEHVGRPVCIRTRDGKFHRGIITDVDQRCVHLRPLEGRGLGGFGYGFGGGFGFGGYGYGYGGGWPIALAAIVGLSALFFW